MQQKRHLAAILFTDIIGSTAIMQKDEQMAVSVNKRYVAALKESVSLYDGEILNDYGDGSLCVFGSAIHAVRCAISIQKTLQSEPSVPLRIGLHIGEVLLEDGKVFGDGVNVASRIQSLGIANSILFSSEINSKLRNQQEFSSLTLGFFRFKNVDEPMEVFALSNAGLTVPDRKKMEGKLQEKKYSVSKLITALGLLLLILSAVLFIRYLNKPAFTGKDKSVAVLPFEAISSEKENEYINDGFTIDIINKLSNLSELTEVPGWARVKTYKNFKGNIVDIANQLGVTAILTGTIQKIGSRIQIVADLTDVNTGKTIWHTNDDREWGDVLTLQNEVAEKIAKSLSAHLTPTDQDGIQKKYTDNAEAYNYYLRGRYFWNNRTPITFDSAEKNFKKAIELDPNYGLAYAGLADLYIYNQKGLTQMEAVPIAREYAEKAISLDSTLAEATTTLGLIQAIFDYDWPRSKATLKKAIQLNPKYPWSHAYYGNLLIYTGENPQEGIDETKIALNLDPLSPSMNWILGRNYLFAGQYPLAEKQLRKAIIISPDYPLNRNYLARSLLARKDFQEAIDTIKKIPQKGFVTNWEYQGTLLVYAYGVSGNLTAAKAELDAILKNNYFKGHYSLAVAYMGINDFTMAMNELDKSIHDKEIFLFFLKVDPIFFPLKNDPRFRELLKKTNFE
jgi:adenylate cyclase